MNLKKKQHYFLLPVSPVQQVQNPGVGYARAQVYLDEIGYVQGGLAIDPPGLLGRRAACTGVGAKAEPGCKGPGRTRGPGPSGLASAVVWKRMG